MCYNKNTLVVLGVCFRWRYGNSEGHQHGFGELHNSPRSLTRPAIWMIDVIQFWMILTTISYFHPNLDDQCHPILDDINNCYFHLNLDGQCHPILDVNACPPKLDGRLHPFLDVYSVILSLFREISQETSIFGWIWCDQSNHLNGWLLGPIIIHFLEAEPASTPHLLFVTQYKGYMWLV